MDKLFFERFELFVYTTVRGFEGTFTNTRHCSFFFGFVAYEEIDDFLFYLNKYIEYQ